MSKEICEKIAKENWKLKAIKNQYGADVLYVYDKGTVNGADLCRVD